MTEIEKLSGVPSQAGAAANAVRRSDAHRASVLNLIRNALGVKPDVLFQSGLGLYSPLHKAVESFDFKAMPTKQLAQRIKNPPGIKQEELDDLGLFEWLEGVDGKVGKDQVLEFIKRLSEEKIPGGR